MKTNLKGLKATQWKKNLKGLFSFEGRELSDSEVRTIVNYAITKGYECDADIPAFEIKVLLGMIDKFRIRALYDNGGIKAGHVYHAQYRHRGSSYKHRGNIMVWGSDSYISDDGRRYGSFAYMDDSIFGNDKVLPIFEIMED